MTEVLGRLRIGVQAMASRWVTQGRKGEPQTGF
jgi:hypothetical protein